MFGRTKITKKSDYATGIDVGNFAVKVVQLYQKGGAFNLEGFGYCKIENGKTEGIVEAIKHACAEAKITHKKVNASIPSEGAIVRYFMLPEMNNEDLRKAMQYEIERYVPFDKKEIISDYLVFKEKPNAKNMKILLVAAKKEYVEQRAKILREAGLEPEVITIDSMVLKNVFLLNYPDRASKTIGLLNIGAKTSNINIVRDQTSYFMRDVQLGGDSITYLLKEKLDLELTQAEAMKCSLTVTDKERFKILEPVLGNLLNEIYLSFDYYESEFGMVVEEVFVSGGTARLTWLVDFLKENLNREVSILNPTSHITLSPAISGERLQSFSSLLTIPLGLALESFN